MQYETGFFQSHSNPAAKHTESELKLLYLLCVIAAFKEICKGIVVVLHHVDLFGMIHWNLPCDRFSCSLFDPLNSFRPFNLTHHTHVNRITSIELSQQTTAFANSNNLLTELSASANATLSNMPKDFLSKKIYFFSR